MGQLTVHDDDSYYRVDGTHEMDPFLMTVVSDSDLWMFVSSSGALTAGRLDPDRALLPYETDDRLHRAAGITGPITVIARVVDGERQLWRPFDRNLTGGCTRAVAKSTLGDRLVFEEHHPGWSTTFRATWAPSDLHGWVRTVELIGSDARVADYEVLDGLLDVMPAGVDAHTEQIRSNLVDAYKRSECGPWGTLAVYSLESLVSDRAEPAEALTATVVWSSGFPDASVELDSHAVDDMLAGRARQPSQLVTGRPGAYLLRGHLRVPASGSCSWTLVADTGLGQAEVLGAIRGATSAGAIDRVMADIDQGSTRLRALLEGADSHQSTGEPVVDVHHLSNVLFNSMRGGVFPHGRLVPVQDLTDFVHERNLLVYEEHRGWLEKLGSWVEVSELRRIAQATDDPDLMRLVLEYLPLTFSRRHGDPSRPWNRFSINVRNEVGEPLLSYEGNWRDIFQNWEALLQSYPAYLPHVVAKFVNASTIDGYNPYRISRHGIDWEVPDPDDPWSHIGYWGDHQIIYLLRLIETWEQHQPAAVAEWLDRRLFVYADVPYAIASHDDIVRDPRNTITYDEDHAAEIADREAALGTDGRLLVDADGTLLRVGLLEKLVVPALAKLTNFVPHGGLWLNTQRPEWNDANNALAGPGLSMVTLYHLRRYLQVLATIIDDADIETATVSASVTEWLSDLARILDEHSPGRSSPTDDTERRRVVDALGNSGTAHRHRVGSGAGHAFVSVPVEELLRFFASAIAHLDDTIAAGRRDDGLYHSYNRISFPTPETARVDRLGPMLEGQVAVLSAGVLDTEASLAVIDALFASEMYRADQDTFMLYPATELPPFVDRNLVPDDLAEHVRTLGSAPSAVERVFESGENGQLHFRPQFVNSAQLEAVLDQETISVADRASILDVYERVFDHHSFTGRSGSMYGYEGLGSVYWHMVAKLLLAIQELYWDAVDRHEPDDVVARAARAYRRVRSGLGFRKDPQSFGAIPTDCYSHTPAHAGAQQPGMTGQVKEEILTRLGELGVRVAGGRLGLAPGLLAPDEVFPTGVDGAATQAMLTVCSVPNTIDRGTTDSVTVFRADGSEVGNNSLELSSTDSASLFSRDDEIERIEWVIGTETMQRWELLASASGARAGSAVGPATRD